MLELIKAYLTRLSGGQLVYSTRRSTQSTGLFTDCNITAYKPGPVSSSTDVGTIWLDEKVYKEASLRAEHPVVYMEVDMTDGFTPTGVTMSVQDYEASLKSVPTSATSEPTQESATI